MSTTSHRQVGVGPSPHCKGAAALNSGTLKWLKAELDLLRMAKILPCIWHKATQTAANHLGSSRGEVWPRRSLVLLLPGHGNPFCFCRPAHCNRTSTFVLVMHFQEHVLMMRSGTSLSLRIGLGFLLIFQYLHPLLTQSFASPIL